MVFQRTTFVWSVGTSNGGASPEHATTAADLTPTANIRWVQGCSCPLKWGRLGGPLPTPDFLLLVDAATHFTFTARSPAGHTTLLQCYLQCARSGEPVDGRLMQHLLTSPVNDGCQWDMLVNLVEKYGVLPKSCWTETKSCEASMRMCLLLSTMIRGYARDIYRDVAEGKTDVDINKSMVGMMERIYKVLAICLGEPPKDFEFAFYSKPEKDASKDAVAESDSAAGDSRVATRLPRMSPLQFYSEHVKPLFNVGQHVCLVHDPRHPTGRLYTVHMLNNMSGARKVLYINTPIEALKRATHDMLADGRPVWFGCHVSKCHDRKVGISDLDLFELNLLFDHDGTGDMNKAERLQFGDSLMTHAMVITAVDRTVHGNYKKWRVENSWGPDYGEKGYQAMSDRWFDEYVYEVAIDKAFLTPEELAVLDQEPEVLPAWDPMGALAQ